MKQAGLHQVQIGIESGHPALLRNMNKACDVDANAKALDNCRELGVTTVVSLIVGFPGETQETLEATCRFLEQHPPDFYYLATFSTRATGVPVLSTANRERFALETFDNAYCMAPYWRHETMSCAQVGNHIRAMNRRLMAGRVALNAVLFYAGMLAYRPQDRGRTAGLSTAGRRGSSVADQRLRSAECMGGLATATGPGTLFARAPSTGGSACLSFS